MGSWTSEPRAWLAREAPWLADAALGTCIVGSAALAEACRRSGLAGPRVGDLDLAWALDGAAAEDLLRTRGVFVATTEQNRARGTLAAKLGGARLEITSYRGPTGNGDLDARLRDDLARRDMTVGALAWRLHDDAIVDPLHGLADWKERRIVACGDAAIRVAEHPIRLLRYHRRAHEWGFTLAPAIRAVPLDAGSLRTIPREALAQEVRAALLRCPSPGELLVELGAAGVLTILVPELAPQFGELPAGPERHHPELTQSRHMTLALAWAAEATRTLPDEDRIATLVAVLCHDLGKNLTPRESWPAHHGHAEAGLPLVGALLDSLPGLTLPWSRRLAETVCALHLAVHLFGEMRAGTLAGLYERWLRHKEFRVDLFALAIGADAGGRAGCTAAGAPTAARVARQVHWLRERCTAVDAAAIAARAGGDVEALRAALHEARARMLTSGPPA